MTIARPHRAAIALMALALIAPGAHAEVDPIRVCQHAPITATAQIARHSDRFGGFYFNYVNAALGGINGRPVEFFTMDDQGYPAGARAAVERCAEHNPDLLLGMWGTDQIVSVAKWAETRRIPYLHGSIGARDSAGLTWSASIAPTAEERFAALAETLDANGDVLSDDKPVVFGMVRLNSPYHQAAHDAFVERLHDLGYELAVDKVVQKDEQQFGDLYFDLQTNNVTILVTDVTANILIRMFNQEPVGYSPHYTTVGGETTVGLVAESQAADRILGFQDGAPAYTPAYTPEGEPQGENSPWYADMQEFRRIFLAYSEEQTPRVDDIDWRSYLRAKQIHRMLLSLHDVSRESIHSLFSSYQEDASTAFPSCALDFATQPGVGEHSWHTMRDTGRDWRELSFCAGPDEPIDLASPTVDCGRIVHLRARMTCSALDAASGIESISFETNNAEPVTAFFRCTSAAETEFTADKRLTAGSVRVRDCSGNVASTRVIVVGSAG